MPETDKRIPCIFYVIRYPDGALAELMPAYYFCSEECKQKWEWEEMILRDEKREYKLGTVPNESRFRGGCDYCGKRDT